MPNPLFALLLSLQLPAAPLYAGDGQVSVCPLPGSDETREDCPWAGAARLLEAAAEAGKPLEPVLAAAAPGLPRQLEADSGSPALALWGESINYDELAKGVIVHDGVLGFLAGRLGTAAPRGRIVHAGMEHTYGYLFSLLPTKFGFKRARWVRPDIEKGLGLPAGAAGPAPAEGTLLGNITCLVGGIALKDDKAAAAALRKALSFCGKAVRRHASRKVKRERLTEEVALPGGRAVELRTDFVPFSSEQGGSSHLLVYSVKDSSAPHAVLVTAFPVGRNFVEAALSPEGLGDDKPVGTRYNAHVEGLTGAGSLRGKRRARTVRF